MNNYLLFRMVSSANVKIFFKKYSQLMLIIGIPLVASLIPIIIKNQVLKSINDDEF